MRCSSMFLLAGFCVAGCEKESVPEAPEKTDKTEPARREQLSGHVLLPLGTMLYRSASDRSAPIAATFSYKYDSYPGLSLFRVVSDKGAWIEVANSVKTGLDKCYWRSMPGVRDAELHFFVRRRDLQPLLKRSYVKEYKDGTKVELKAGVAVSRIARSAKSRIEVNDIALQLRLPAKNVGLSFQMENFFAKQGGTDNPEEEATLPIISSDTLAAKKLLINGSIAVTSTDSEPEDSSVRLLRSTGKGELVMLRRGCVRVQAIVPKALVKPPRDPGYISGILGGLVGATQGPFVVAESAPVYWRGGARAGKIVRAVSFAEAKPDGKRLCFSQTLPRTAAPPNQSARMQQKLASIAKVSDTLELCFDPADVREVTSK